MWAGLKGVELAVEWPLWTIVWLTPAAWVPHLGWTIERAWEADIREAVAIGSLFGYRDGYGDCATIKGS